MSYAPDKLGANQTREELYHMSNYIDEAAAAIEKFYIERPIKEVREIFEKVYPKIKTTNYRQEYAALLREYADRLDS